MKSIGLDDVIMRRNSYLQTRLDDETIVMHIDSGRIFGLADTAEAVWRTLEEPMPFRRLIALMAETFEVAPATCREEVGRFLANLEELGMIEVRPTPLPSESVAC